MTDDHPFTNPYWRRLAEARPRLKDQARISRQEIRGKLWYVVEDALSGRHFRLTPEAWHFVGLLDGSRTVEQSMDAVRQNLGEVAPKQEEVIRLLSQLHAAGMISTTEGAHDVSEQYERSAKMRRRRIVQQLRSPLAIRFPLIDPDRLLEKFRPLARIVFSPLGFALWLGVVSYGTSIAALHFDELSHNFVDRVLSTENVVLMVVVFAVMKLFHEFGHGAAVKRWGGETHEMGIMLLVLIPVPYVDASAANSFPSRFRRIAVSAAGMYVEAFLAALAIILWSGMEPGVARAAMYNAALIGSVSTFFFNANPLLRFDGYYILSDLLSIPNLGTRGNNFVRYALERRLLRLDDAATPEAESSERFWLFCYAVAAACYRVFIVGLIAFFIAQKFFFIGVLLAIWAVLQLILLPVLGALSFLAFSPRLSGLRVRSWFRAGVAAAVVAGLIFALPAPRTTYAHGVIWVPEEGEVVARADGFVREVLAEEGAWVEAGDRLIVAENIQLETERDRLSARLRGLEARYRSDFVTDRVAMKLTRVELAHVRQRLAELGRKIEGLELTAGVAGWFALALPDDLIGRYIRRGERLGFVIPFADPTIRVAVGQNEIGLIREDLQGIKVLPVVPGSTSVPAELIRAVPAATAELPSMALATIGGGDIEIAADENGNYRALEDLFHFELHVPEIDLAHRVGQKVHVKFVHGAEPIGFQLWRWLRQLFLRKLNV